MFYFKILFLILLLFSTQCNSIKYKEDLSMFSSGLAKSPQAIVWINGGVCRSMNKVGLCYLEQSRNKDLIIILEPMPYAYNFSLICSSYLHFNVKKLIPAHAERMITIPSNKYDTMIGPNGKETFVFNCEGSFRQVENSDFAFKYFSMRIKIIEEKFKRIMKIEKVKYKRKWYMVFGQYAKYGMIQINNKKKYWKKKPIYKIGRNYQNIRAWSCSSQERCNYYGYQ